MQSHGCSSHQLGNRLQRVALRGATAMTYSAALRATEAAYS